MPVNRFFTSHLSNQTPEVSLDADENHHMIHILRLQEGEPVELIDGKGNLATAILKKRGKKQSKLELTSFQHIEKAPYSLHLIQGLLSDKKRLHLLLEKACEIGVDSISFYQPQKNKGPQKTSQDKLEEIAKAALKQSGRLYLPQIKLFSSLDRIPLDAPCLLMASTDKNCPLLLTQLQNQKIKPLSVFLAIGAESGFSEKEVELLLSHNAQAVSLGSQTLRSETASLIACGLIEHYWLL